MSILSFSSLFGCTEELPSAVHSVSQLRAVAISCSEMDQSYSYSFVLHNADDVWLLDASCFTQQNEVETELADCVISEEEINAVFDILEQDDSIAFIENYVAKQKNNKSAMDGSTYGFTMTFSDGIQLSADKRQSNLESFLYSLTEKYTNSELNQ